jgi:hypothetical protein
MMSFVQLATLVTTLLSLFLTLKVFGLMSRQEHEALAMQTRHKDRVVKLLFESLPSDSVAAESARAVLAQLETEMRELRARHQHEARWWFHRFRDAAFSAE